MRISISLQAVQTAADAIFSLAETTQKQDIVAEVHQNDPDGRQRQNSTCRNQDPRRSAHNLTNNPQLAIFSLASRCLLLDVGSRQENGILQVTTLCLNLYWSTFGFTCRNHEQDQNVRARIMQNASPLPPTGICIYQLASSRVVSLTWREICRRFAVCSPAVGMPLITYSE